MRPSYHIILLPLLGFILAGCGDEKKTPAWSFFPDMHQQPSVYAYEEEPVANGGRSARMPVEGTIPVKFTASTSPKDQINPFDSTRDILEAGQRNYNIYCIVCHGEKGDGKGSVALKGDGELFGGRKLKYPAMAIPPTPINTDNVKNMTDGIVFEKITLGGPIMPPYRHLAPEVRWSIVHYLRVLYKASHPTQEELNDYRAHASDYSDVDPHAQVVDWKKYR